MILTKKRTLLAIAVVILVTVIILSSFVYLSSQKPYEGNIENITLGLIPHEFDSLIYIAYDQQYFIKNGLNVNFKNYTSGLNAVNGMLNGESDISSASEFVLVGKVMQNEDNLLSFGSVSKYLSLDLIARTDKGINSISDLKGKTIAVSFGSNQQFFLGRFLELNGINLNQVTLIDMSIPEQSKSLVNGTVDAIISFQPYINQIESLLGDKIVRWSAQADQLSYAEVYCTRDWAMSHSDIIVRFLKALVQAEKFTLNNNDQAEAIVTKSLNYTNPQTESIWSDYQFSVTIDQSLVIALQDEAQWIINNHFTNKTTTPNMLDYIYIDGLAAVKPESVNIIR
jgi:NitT/TauT family transport system substrate-binding protein